MYTLNCSWGSELGDAGYVLPFKLWISFCILQGWSLWDPGNVCIESEFGHDYHSNYSVTYYTVYVNKINDIKMILENELVLKQLMDSIILCFCK